MSTPPTRAATSPTASTYRLLEDADEDQALVAVEDCRTLDVVLLPTTDLRERMQPVEQRALTLST